MLNLKHQQCIQQTFVTCKAERRSAAKGSTRVLRALSFPRARAELVRTVLHCSLFNIRTLSYIRGILKLRFRCNLALSCRHLMNVVWSCGRNGFRAIPPLLIRMDNVDKIAALTCQVNLSPKIRMRGLDKNFGQRIIHCKYIIQASSKQLYSSSCL